ncbi:MAG: hypothetical protein ACRD5G_01225, partial [Candidatus Acidiferrales bacterium]
MAALLPQAAEAVGRLYAALFAGWRLKALRALANGKLKPALRQHRWANGPAPQSIPAPAFVGK